MKNALFAAQIFAFCLFAFDIKGQQTPLLGIPREHLTALNPAAVAADFSYENYFRAAGAAHRQQFLGVPDGPVFSTAFFDFQSPKTRLGGGLRLVSDRAGKLGQQSVGGSFRYVLPVSRAKNLWLAAGLGAAATNFQFKINEIQLRDADDPLASSARSAWFADVSAGVFLFRDRVFGLGFSMPQAFEFSPNFEVGGDQILERKRHFMAFGNCFVPLPSLSREAFLEPSIWFRSVGSAPKSVDFGLRILPNRHFWAGIGAGTAAFRAETGFFVSPKMRHETESRASQPRASGGGRGKLSLAFDFFYRKTRGTAIEAAFSTAWGGRRD